MIYAPPVQVVRSLLRTLTKSLGSPLLRGQLTGSMMALSLYGQAIMFDDILSPLKLLKVCIN